MQLLAAAERSLAAARQAAPAAQAASSSAAASPAPHTVCASPGCGATHDLRRCAACGVVSYCSRACQTAHWRAHCMECKLPRAERTICRGRRLRRRRLDDLD